MKTGSYTRRNQIQIQTIAETSKIKIKKNDPYANKSTYIRNVDVKDDETGAGMY